jgi:hypothetical protein
MRVHSKLKDKGKAGAAAAECDAAAKQACVSIYMLYKIYNIYTEREREGEREKDRERNRERDRDREEVRERQR